MFSEFAIEARQIAKCYTLYAQPIDRLKQMLFRHRRKYYREFWALRDVSFELRHGEILGIVGRNGAGKSTLLQILSGTVTPSSGTVAVNGRIAALLELGAGFNPEFTGRENIRFNGMLLGLSSEQVREREEEIIAFADIGQFIDQPVKTYSSGMFVRLAFSVATSVAPDILIVDEALSVGDSQFSRKSFERIMALKDAGTTILFCSHSMYQIESLCNRALWLEAGQMRAYGGTVEVVQAYNAFLDGLTAANQPPPDLRLLAAESVGSTRVAKVQVLIDGERARVAHSKRSTLEVVVDFIAEHDQHPSVGILIQGLDGKTIASAGTQNDGLVIPLDERRHGRARLRIERLPLLKGEYVVTVYLLCDRALYEYEVIGEAGRFKVEQEGMEIGVVNLAHDWVIGDDE